MPRRRSACGVLRSGGLNAFVAQPGAGVGTAAVVTDVVGKQQGGQPEADEHRGDHSLSDLVFGASDVISAIFT